MNKVFRVVWNAAMQRFVVASELAKGKVKSSSLAIAAGNSTYKTFAISGVALALALASPSVFAVSIIANGATLTYDGQDITATGSGEFARGLSATNNGVINFSNGSVTTTAAAGFGAFVDTNATIKLDNTTINTAGTSAQGIYAKGAGSVTGDGVHITTSGTTAYGIQTSNGSVSLANSSVTTTGANATGIVAAGTAGKVTLTNSTVETAANGAQGIYIKDGATVSGDGAHVTTKGNTAYGVQNVNSYVTLTNSSVNTVGEGAIGVVSTGAAGNTTISDSLIHTTGDTAHALFASGGAQITVNNSEITAEGHFSNGAKAAGAGSVLNVNNSNITTSGASAEAVLAYGGGTVNLTNTNIFTDRVNSYGLRANGGNAVVNYDGGSVTTTGGTSTVQAINGGALNINNATLSGGATTVYGYSNGAINLDNVIINNDGSQAKVAAGIYANGAGTAFNAKNVQVNTTGTNVNGIQLVGVHSTLDNVEINSAVRGGGLQAYGGSNIVAKNLRVNIESQDALDMSTGLTMGSAAGDNNVEMSNSQIAMQGANNTALMFKSDAISNNTLSLTDSAVTSPEGTAMMVTGTANTQVTTSGTLLTGATLLSAGAGNTAGVLSNVELTGDNGSVFNGDVIIDRANTAKNIINLDNNSVWNGATSSLETLNVSNGSAWNVSKSSAVDNLTLDNGTLNMTAPGTGYSEVTVGNLTSNNGTLDFKTHLGDDSSVTDDLIITGDYSGNSKVVVQNAGGTGAPTINGIELIRVDGNVNGTFAQQGRIVAGAYDYHLVQDGNKWVLRDDVVGGVGGDTGAPVVGDGSGAPIGGGSGAPIGSGSGAVPVKGKPITRPETGSYAANLAAANTLFTTSLDDRLGETHYIGADGKKHATSLWLRNAGGHTRFSDSSGQLKTTGNRYVMQLGGDIAQWSSNGADRFHLGVMGGYANAQSNTHSNVTGYTSKGQVHGYSTGFYATWLQDNEDKTGAYVDSWMLYNWFDNSVKGDGIAEESYKSKGFTASVEAGYAFKVAEMSERSSFYLQPKAQATWMGVKADDHKEHNGTRVVGEGDNNVQTRLGVRAYIKGHNAIDDGKNRTFEPFIEANWVHNTESYGSSMNGVSVQQAGARNLGEVKVGVDAKLNQTVNLWGNIGQQMGDKGYSDTSAMVGVKVNF
ncbi:autotransporter family porin [Candidatus Pantoea symbiotica]|jgi:autotransporter family porin|uniref:Autotransporter family porin n=1 Tax=Candidatus Pantoea symbiotica TaxID=1884370 RepID=A0A1I3ZJJ9_9GAMM|nr:MULTISPECIES: autotransporter outer membrane beta-barrel domain-containing protein [Pantoea]KAJ9430013.1 autotransporter outer membrane beta-barrel domain-containing protein [Pantoea sp. YR343]MRT26954.1 autotransporter outer membrane beta-barrel domain-containing protein [Enterobacteriaceae bacterium RIT697]SFK44214.1 autotransporter family porin [Pantoea symbiotica]SFU93350.1 autotransporter family porin [Pantoea sp. YR525]